MDRRWFTLIELMVVMLIISILASLLMPALQEARHSAQTTVCMSNLRQFGECFSMYRGDNDGELPPNHNMGSGDADGYDSWYLLYPSYLSDARLFLCPSDAGNEIHKGKLLREQTFGAYLDRQGNFQEPSHRPYYHGDRHPKWSDEDVAHWLGITCVDDVSYAYAGSSNKVRDLRQAEQRIAADNETEGREMPVGEWRYKAGHMDPGMYRGKYYYVGGLEDQDNHGQRGVNVLYADWHVEFDSRAWPSPIGTSWDHDWERKIWDRDPGQTIYEHQRMLDEETGQPMPEEPQPPED